MLPYLGIVLMLRKKTRKQGLALALWWSTVPLLVLGATIVHRMETGLLTKQHMLDSGGAWGLAALYHAVMLGAAIKTYYSMPREPGDQRKLADGLATAGVLLLLLLLAGVDIPSMMSSLVRLRE